MIQFIHAVELNSEKHGIQIVPGILLNQNLHFSPDIIHATFDASWMVMTVHHSHKSMFTMVYCWHRQHFE